MGIIRKFDYASVERLKATDALSIGNEFGCTFLNLGEDGAPAISIKYVEANSGTLTGATDTIALAIPAGALLISVSLRNDVAVVDSAGNDTYTAAFSGGSTIAINGGSAIAAAANTKVNEFIDANAAKAITTDVTNITLTPNGGVFSAGQVTARVVYAVVNALASV